MAPAPSSDTCTLMTEKEVISDAVGQIGENLSLLDFVSHIYSISYHINLSPLLSSLVTFPPFTTLRQPSKKHPRQYIFGVGKRARAVLLLGTITAGKPFPVPSDDKWHSVALETLTVKMLPRQIRAYALRIKGTSCLMLWSITAILSSWRRPGNLETRGYMKKLYRRPGRVRLRAANRSMAPIYLGDP